ncbi:hypothetical protein HanRHA438_Chr03g0100461 [Helianthus annuus]|nr:hypothetical protein HanRHA438_Chr03g0100461 [Helianthus annuus]
MMGSRCATAKLKHSRGTRQPSRHATDLENPVAARDKGDSCRFCLFCLIGSRNLTKHVLNLSKLTFELVLITGE